MRHSAFSAIQLAVMSAAFDVDSFLSAPQEAGLQTKFIQVEPGDYPAHITKLGMRSYPKKDKPEETVDMLDITYAIDDQRQKEVTGMEEPTCRQSLFLDLVNGKLDRSKNKNVALGRVLEALGLNDRKEFSFNDLIGRPCMVKVELVANEKSPEDPFRNVTKVGKLGA